MKTKPIITTCRFQNLIQALFCAGILTCSSVARQAAADEATFTTGPYLQSPGKTTMTVMWESPVKGESTVRYGLNGALDQTAQGKAPQVIAAGRTNHYLYTVTIDGLQPAGSYSYSASLLDAESSPKHFRTFADHPAKVRFIAYGDTRSNPTIHAALAKWFKKYDPDFILHTGDLVSNGANYDLWDKEFFAPLAEVIDEIPLLPAIGNHEANGTNYLAQFHLGGAELWYTFDDGPIHVLALDYRSTQLGSPQYAFASKDLDRCHAPWKMVFVHVPMFNFGGHNSTWGQETYLPLFHQGKVDLVLGGHSHIYERFKPLTSAADKGKWAITHITTGGGGAPLHGTRQDQSHAMTCATNHFLVFEVTEDTIKGQAIGIDGNVFDEFIIKKTNGEYDQTFLDSTYDESTVTEDIKKTTGKGKAK